MHAVKESLKHILILTFQHLCIWWPCDNKLKVSAISCGTSNDTSLTFARGKDNTGIILKEMHALNLVRNAGEHAGHTWLCWLSWLLKVTVRLPAAVLGTALVE